MSRTTFEEMCLPANEGRLWELFHENSKTSRFDPPLPEREVLAWMKRMWQSLPFEGYPQTPLPEVMSPFRLSLEETLRRRVSAHRMEAGTLRLEELASLLYYCYGITRDNADNELPRPFRIVPSAGALYPLEVFFATSRVTGLDAGLYHYSPVARSVQRLRSGDQGEILAPALVQPQLVSQASAIFFVTALFERSTFKYGERGYRFVLLEAGHLAQNLNLAATGLGLASLNLGGFFDRQVDEFLGVDGVRHSTVYLVAVGHPVGAATG